MVINDVLIFHSLTKTFTNAVTSYQININDLRDHEIKIVKFKKEYILTVFSSKRKIIIKNITNCSPIYEIII